jgi:hypothetical protein
MLSVTGDALVGHVIRKESTKLQLTSVFFFLKRQNMADFDLERQDIPRDFRLGKVAFYFYA